ncbi:MAG TPA: transcription antitermination factor NusB [Anaerovibrio sp.]|uniref:transcription antitermination factor NusB n=1 Tax=Anaerovibrio lipolyticus TaxID=82374 RepID=UPI000E98717B|nr:transcription antitermination factor NusB [Anaerovibrio lipolyticus]MBR1698056.1 transcription antitermination factor NusB [Anaerovibrio sp.]HAF32399.1 transcription antitermination factor NusB [Anaerovibrio sp.]HAQ55702.1 transcription antitermination factor NusB [Anaerovibrio sp.]HCP95029.1 transcription antitermination factor NusB [Anaerovibrio sp.]
MSRRQAREVALQALFQLDMNPLDEGMDVAQARQNAIDAAVFAKDEDVKLGSKDMDFLKGLVNGTLDNQEPIDEMITTSSKEWKLQRMAGVDRNITRMAVYELKFCEEKLTPNIIINEAVELAKKFGTDESSRFVNGILGAIARV